MKRSIRAASSAALLALSLAGCGSGGGSAPAPATHAAGASSTQRAAQSLPRSCTPDAYGYCLQPFGYPLQYARTCTNDNGELVSYEVFRQSYELYYNGVAVREYTQSNEYGAGCPPAYVWSPSDPRADTGDPNLP